MTGHWILGRVRGIPIGLHWSLVLLFVLLTNQLAGVRFPRAYPQIDSGTLWLMAIATGVMLFVSILLHELGHAIIAQRNGLPVRSITLFMFGGVAQIERRSPSAGVEFRVASGGPLVSFMLFLLFGILTVFAGLPDEIQGPVAWLTRINGLLLVFNLIPGYPLDGGRILRAIVWFVTKSDRTSIRVAAVSGQIVAFGMIGFGAFSAINGNLVNGLWIILIGWFIKGASISETSAISTEHTLEGLTVGQVMQRDIRFVPSRTRIQQLVDERVIGAGERAFIVADDEQDPRGLITVDNMARFPRERWPWVSVAEAMIPWRSVFHLRSELDVLTAIRLMAERQSPVAVVTDRDRLIGFLTPDQIAWALHMANGGSGNRTGPGSDPGHAGATEPVTSR